MTIATKLTSLFTSNRKLLTQRLAQAQANRDHYLKLYQQMGEKAVLLERALNAREKELAAMQRIVEDATLAQHHLAEGLDRIIRQCTPRANGTVSRMAKIAYDTLYPNGGPADAAELAEARRNFEVFNAMPSAEVSE